MPAEDGSKHGAMKADDGIHYIAIVLRDLNGPEMDAYMIATGLVEDDGCTVIHASTDRYNSVFYFCGNLDALHSKLFEMSSGASTETWKDVCSESAMRLFDRFAEMRTDAGH